MNRLHMSFLSLFFITILSLSMFMVNCQAYTFTDSSFYIEFDTYSDYYQNTFKGGGTWSAGNNQNARCIVFKNDEMSQKLHDYYTWENQVFDNWLCVFYLGGGFDERYIGTPSKGCSPVINTDWFKEKMGINSIPRGLDAMGYSLDSQQLIDGSWFSGVTSVSQVKVGGNNVSTDSIQYVTTFEDLKKYLIDGDNSVVKIGDPTNTNQIVNTYNKNIPVPQEVEVYKNSSNPTLVWKNPIISGDSDIQVDIEWNPTIDCLNGRQVIDTLNYGTYMPLYWDSLDDHNAFITKQFDTSQISNDLMGYNYILDEKCLYKQGGGSHFSDLSTTNVLQFVETPLIYLMGEDKFNSFNIRKLDYRIRYIIGNEYGDWIYSNRNYGMDNTSPSPHSTTSRRNPSGDPVPNDNYQPNNDPNIINVYASSGDAGSSWWVRFNNDTLSIFNIFTNRINEEQASMVNNDDDNGSSDSIFAVVADFFKEFPIFMVFLISGFAVVVFLRIFGR